jgi:hypothetical protein
MQCGDSALWFNITLSVFMYIELNLLRNVDANNTENSTTVKNSSLLSGFRGGSSYNHETETIFALPRMQLEFKSIHVQEPQEPSLQGMWKISNLIKPVM